MTLRGVLVICYRHYFFGTLISTKNFFHLWTCGMYDIVFEFFFPAELVCMNLILVQVSCRLYKNHPPTNSKVKWSTPNLLETWRRIVNFLQTCQRCQKENYQNAIFFCSRSHYIDSSFQFCISIKSQKMGFYQGVYLGSVIFKKLNIFLPKCYNLQPKTSPNKPMKLKRF